MKRALAGALMVIGLLAAAGAGAAAPVAAPPSEALVRERNLGTAEYENEEYPKGAAHFREATKLAPTSAVDHVNLGVCALQARDHDTAIAALLKARELDPPYPHVPYLLGLAYLRLEQLDKARVEFETLLKLDPLCAPAEYNLGVVFKKAKQDDEAARHWAEAVRLDANHGPAHFQLFNLYTARGDREKAQAEFREYNRVKEQNLGPGTSAAAVEKSRYLGLIIETLPAKPAAAGAVTVTLQDVTGAAGLEAARGAAAALADFDDDGDLDLLVGRMLYRNDQGHFSDVSAGAGLGGGGAPACADAGDFNNDGKLDVVFGTGAGLALYRGRGDGTFEDVSEAAGLSALKWVNPCAVVRFVDIDHEGDLDIVVGSGGADHALRLLRNNGNGTVTEVTEPARWEKTRGPVAALVLADFDGRNDIDVLVRGGASALYLNQRDGTFRENAGPAGLRAAKAGGPAVGGDLNGDGLADLILLGAAGQPAETWLNRAGSGFARDGASPVLGRASAALAGRAGALVDLDNDGDLDLVLAGGKGSRGLGVFLNDGAGGWTDASEAVLAGVTAGKEARVIRSGDLDGDGDQDVVLVAPEGGVTVLRNEGGNRNQSVRVRLRGRKNNPDGYGAKVWVRQGSFFVLREAFARWIDIGVGTRTAVDVAGLRWPTGVTQNQLDVAVAPGKVLEFPERPGLAESCPFVYAFDGTAFRFVTDFLDTTPLGISLIPGTPFVPNHREAFRIPGARLQARDGRLSLRITQELKEITYLDQLRLYAVDHPAGVEIVPNDRFSERPFAPFAIHAVVPRVPRAAEDGAGQDVSAALRAADRLYADDCPPVAPRYPGVTHPQTLVLDPGPVPQGAALRLFLRGTTLWTDASVNVAVAQNPDLPMQPVALDVVGPDGAWRRVRDDVGLPAGMDKLLPIDLSGLVNVSDPRVRISTNLAVLWDQAFFAFGGAENESPTISPLAPLFAELGYRGFSEVESPDGKLPDVFVYERLAERPPFDERPAGRYTRYGEVVELLGAADDRYVILAPGDEIAVDFPAIALPELPPGWERDYVLDTDGWIKDMDLRTLHGETVEPLPFHGMSGYPYPPTEHYPNDAAHRRYLETYQTRALSGR